MNPIGMLLLPLMLAVQDTIVVDASGEGQWGTVTLEEQLVIGALNGPAEYSFGAIGSTRLGADGSVFVNDLQVPVIRRYDSRGRYLGDVGGSGQGPGEYRQVIGMQVLSDGRLAAWDPGNGRITVYRNGAYDSAFRVAGGFYSSDLLHVDTAGVFYVKVRRESGAQRSDGGLGWMRVMPSGTVMDTLPIAPSSSTPSFTLQTPQGTREPFPTTTTQTVSPHGYVIEGRNSEYSFSRPLPDGRILRVRRDYEAVRIGRAEQRQWEAFGEYFGRRPGGGEYTTPEIPRFKPPYRSFFADVGGRIWVSRYVEAVFKELTEEQARERADRPHYEWREPSTWDVFTPGGAFLGTVELPQGILLSDVSGDIILGLRRGEFNEQYVVRLQMHMTRRDDA